MLIKHKQLDAVPETYDKPKYVWKLGVPWPAPPQIGVLLNNKTGWGCHYDLHLLVGDGPLPLKMALIGGHFGNGPVVVMGKLVTERKIRDLVGLKWMMSYACPWSKAEWVGEQICPWLELSGLALDLGFVNYCTANTVHALIIKESTFLEVMAPIVCAVIGYYRFFKEHKVGHHRWIAIPGAPGTLLMGNVIYKMAMRERVGAISRAWGYAEQVLSRGGEVVWSFTKEIDMPMAVTVCTNAFALGTIFFPKSPVFIEQAMAFGWAQSTMVNVIHPGLAKQKEDIKWQTPKWNSICVSLVGNRLDRHEALHYHTRGLQKLYDKVGLFSLLPDYYGAMHINQIFGRVVDWLSSLEACRLDDSHRFYEFGVLPAGL
uniref:Alkane hydroxylase n=1 Tax=Stenotrophomonas maltophilia TaxID=40324 RepID=Q54425_STEMA|nr:alkane hydroxylase [Stenotrophomonas maltophilia]